MNGHATDFKLDTGADGTVVGDCERWLKDMQLETTDASLRGPGGSHLRVLGSFKATPTYRQRRHQETVYVIKNQSSPLPRRTACVGRPGSSQANCAGGSGARQGNVRWSKAGKDSEVTPRTVQQFREAEGLHISDRSEAGVQTCLSLHFQECTPTTEGKEATEAGRHG